MSRIIKSRNDRLVYMHKPIGVSNTKRAAYLSIGEVLKKTSIVEQNKMIENSPLYDEFKAGTPIESLDLLEFVDLSTQPIDFTDAEALHNLAKAQVSGLYEKYKKIQEQKAASAPSALAASAVLPAQPTSL